MLIDYRITRVATATTTPSAIMPPHQSGDLIVIMDVADANPTIGTPSGWTSQQNAAVTNVSGRMLTKVAASSSETYTGTNTTSEEHVIIAVVCRGVDGTTPVNVSSVRSIDDTSRPFAGSGLTTTSNDCVVLHFLAADGSLGLQPSAVGIVPVDSGRAAASGGCSGIFAYEWKATAGAVSAPNWTGDSNTSTLAFTIAIKGDGTRKPVVQQADISIGDLSETGFTAGTNPGPSGNTFPTSLSLATIGSKNTAYVGASNSTGDGINPQWSGLKLNVSTTAAGDVEGNQCNFGSAKDLSSRLVVMNWKCEGVANYLGLPVPSDAAGAGILWVARDGSDYKAWSIGAQGTKTTKPSGANYAVIQVDQATDTTYASSGTPVPSAIDGFLMLGQGFYAGLSFIYSGVFAVNTIAPTGGTSANPITFDEFVDFCNRVLGTATLAIREGSAVTLLAPVQFGGTSDLFIDVSRKTLQYRTRADETNYLDFHVDENRVGFEFYPGGGFYDCESTTFVSDSPQYWKFHSTWSSMADGSWLGATVIGLNVTLRSTVSLSSMSFINCPTFTQNGATLNSITFSGTPVTCNDPSKISNSTFTKVSSEYALILTTPGTYTVTGNTFTGYGATGTTSAAVYNNSGGAVTINLGTGDVAPTYYNGAGASTTINEDEQTQSIAVNVSALIQLFETGTTTLITSGTGTTLDWTFVSAIDFDIKVQAAGYLEYYQTGLTLADGVLPVSLSVDLVENTSHGLVYGTDLSVNTSTKRLTAITRQRGSLFYSLLKEAYRAETALRNKPFPLLAVGADYIVFLDGWEHVNSTSLDNWYDAGIDYRDASFVRTAAWVALESAGDIPSGTVCEYQQVAGGTVTDMRTSGPAQQIIQVYGDSLHGNFTRYSHLVVKAQPNGYYEARADIVALSGANLTPRKYSFALQPLAVDITTGSSGATIAVTDHGASPVTWNGGQVGITITSDASGDDIAEEYNYRKSLDATWLGFEPFNLPEIFVKAGTKWETQRGTIEGSAGTNPKGVRVLTTSGAAHPDFSRFQFADGSYYTPPVVSSISGTSMPTTGTRFLLQIANMTGYAASAWTAGASVTAGTKRRRTTGIGTEEVGGLYFVVTTAGTTGATEPTWNTTVGGNTNDNGVVWKTCAVLFYSDDPASATYAGTYVNGEEFSTGDTYQVQFAALNADISFHTYETTGVVSSTGFSFVVDPQEVTPYATWGFDGEAQDSVFSPNYVDDRVVLDSNTNYHGRGAGAYYCYILTTPEGMWNFWGGVTIIDAGNIRINTAILDLLFDETAGFVYQLDDVRIFRDDGLRPAMDPTTGGAGIEINWRTPVLVTTTGDGPLTGPQEALLAAAANAATPTDVTDALSDYSGGTLEGSVSRDQALRLILAETLGNADTDTGTGVTTYKGLDGTTTRFTSVPIMDGDVVIGRTVDDINGA